MGTCVTVLLYLLLWGNSLLHHIPTYRLRRVGSDDVAVVRGNGVSVLDWTDWTHLMDHCRVGELVVGAGNLLS